MKNAGTSPSVLPLAGPKSCEEKVFEFSPRVTGGESRKEKSVKTAAEDEIAASHDLLQINEGPSIQVPHQDHLTTEQHRAARPRLSVMTNSVVRGERQSKQAMDFPPPIEADRESSDCVKMSGRSDSEVHNEFESASQAEQPLHSDDFEAEAIHVSVNRLEIIDPDQIEMSLHQDTEYSPRVPDKNEKGRMFSKNFF